MNAPTNVKLILRQQKILILLFAFTLVSGNCFISTAWADINDVFLNEVLFNPHNISPSDGQDCNGNGVIGEDGNGVNAGDEFVEFYNNGMTNVTLSGYCISNADLNGGSPGTPSNRRTWLIPGGQSIPAGGRWHVCGYDTTGTGTFGFSIPDANGDQVRQFANGGSGDGRCVSLYQPTSAGDCRSGVGTVFFSNCYPTNESNGESYKRCSPDGTGNLGYYDDGNGNMYLPSPGDENCTASTPVTLAYFETTPMAGGVYFTWSTATEAGNVGFHLYVKSENGRERINQELIPTHNPDALTPQDYTYEAPDTVGDQFWLADVDFKGVQRFHGPFDLYEAYGKPLKVEPIDWKAISAEQKTKQKARFAKRKRHAMRKKDAAVRMAEAADGPAMSNVGTNVLTDGDSPAVELHIKADGIYRISYEDLLAMGVDFTGVKNRSIAVTQFGVPIPIYLPDGNGGRFGPGSSIEFYAEAIDSLYTRTNVFKLHVDKTLARRIGKDRRRIRQGIDPAPYYLETVEINTDKQYSFASPTGDPWYNTSMLTYRNAKTWSFPITLDAMAVEDVSPTIMMGLWGVTDWPQDPDHHVILEVNGTPVAETQFDGLVDAPVTVELPTGLLMNGENTLSVTLPGDTGADYDMVNLDRYAVTYPRAFIARDGLLAFEGKGKVFKVDGLPTSDVAIYRIAGGKVRRLTEFEVQPVEETFSVTFRGRTKSARYIVSTVQALPIPEIQPARPYIDITSKESRYLIISHPDFITGITPLVSAREAQGYSVGVVDVEEIYAQFGFGIVDPEAIRDYITHAVEHMNTEVVLLVGGDTYDYFDNLGLGSVSFIPSIYTRTDDIVAFAPVDPLFADIDRDGVPDLPIGRFPVRTDAELETIIEKTLAYPSAGHHHTAVFAADRSFSANSDELIVQLPTHWNVQAAYLDDLDTPDARDLLLAEMNNGVALASYFGHSGLTEWTFDGLFSATDAGNLTNTGQPMVVTQWGCWNTYHVQPNYNTLAHRFLLSGDQGAAAVLGATTLAQSRSDKALGLRVLENFFHPGNTIGMAVQVAKTELASTHPEMVDVILGWTLLGDPTLAIEP